MIKAAIIAGEWLLYPSSDYSVSPTTFRSLKNGAKFYPYLDGWVPMIRRLKWRVESEGLLVPVVPFSAG